MGQYKYFAIPFESVPASPTYIVYYATWSRTPPDLEPGMRAPLVVGITTGALPTGATYLGEADKDPPPPPPPPSSSVSLSDYQQTIAVWLELGRDAA